MKVLHRARGWTAVWSGKLSLRRSLPGDTPELVAALHALNDAGLLPPNLGFSFHRGPCPRCGRATAVGPGDSPSVCTACRAEWIEAAWHRQHSGG
jgi:hypothetical protein